MCSPELLLPLCAVLNGFTGSTGLLHGASAAAATWEENPARALVTGRHARYGGAGQGLKYCFGDRKLSLVGSRGPAPRTPLIAAPTLGGPGHPGFCSDRQGARARQSHLPLPESAKSCTSQGCRWTRQGGRGLGGAPAGSRGTWPQELDRAPRLGRRSLIPPRAACQADSPRVG